MQHKLESACEYRLRNRVVKDPVRCAEPMDEYSHKLYRPVKRYLMSLDTV